ncbi:hypothetical protein [Nocardioides agariphilus]|uniref:hypothetical protein n=1 Tax=Nocardioides agariphilus TaxID=433664 RepID=UPI003F9BC69C
MKSRRSAPTRSTAPAITGADSSSSHVQTKTRARYGSEVIVGLCPLPRLVHPSGQQRQAVSSLSTQTRKLGAVLSAEQRDPEGVGSVERIAERNARVPRFDRGDSAAVDADALGQLGRRPLARDAASLDLLGDCSWTNSDRPSAEISSLGPGVEWPRVRSILSERLL